ncbi:MAG TPA: YCF48-related protein [Chitinophagales bacterium]|nr:YCF48-related protein [Chitinophagales bacterium]HRG86962.1 YCF48-related protein [Chitinophagales bacterium]
MKQLTFFLFFIISLTCCKQAACQWVKISDLPNSSFIDLYFINDTIGFTIGREFIYKTTDGGLSWDTTQLGTSLDVLFEFDFYNQDTGFIVGEVSGSRAFVTYDQGVNWSNIPPYAFASEIAVINPNEFLWAVSGTFGVNRYNIALGLEYAINPGIGVSDLTVFSEDTIYVGGGGFARSFDSGENWEIIDMPGILWMDFPTPQIGYAAADNYFKTMDYGETWVELELPYFFDGCSSPEVVSDSIVYFPCGYDDIFDYHGIMKTIDGGVTWIFNESIPPLFDDDAIGKIFCLNKDTCWCVTYTGQIYYTSNGGGETEPPVTVIENPSTNFSIYPNPVGDFFTLELNESLELGEINIVNTIGEYIPFSVTSNNGSQKVIDIKNAPPGIYLIKFGNNSQTFIKL